MLSASGGGKGDIFAQVQDKYRCFVLVNEQFVCLDTDETFAVETVKELVKAIETPRGFKSRVIFEASGLIYIKHITSKRGSKQTLDDHSTQAKRGAEELRRVLGVDVVNATMHHDDGKAHWLWQLASRGRSDGEALAKVGYFVNPGLLGGMRHELVSVLNNPDLTDLCRWLIASHHGRCRPFFEEKSYDPERLEESAALNAELPVLLERLHAGFGYWGLAYLEAVVRAVDINAEGDGWNS